MKGMSVSFLKKRQLALLSTALISSGIHPKNLRWARSNERWMILIPRTQVAQACLKGFLAAKSTEYMIGVEPPKWEEDFPQG